MARMKPQSRHTNWTVALLYLSYVIYVFVRRSFSFLAPAVVQNTSLDKSQLGLILSSQSLAYTLSNFGCGVLMDIVSPGLALSTGLFLSGVTALGFTLYESSIVMSFWWFLNGLSQGPGWPAIAVILKKLCSPDQFGTTWSVVSTSMNVAGTGGPLLSTYLVSIMGWQSCMQVAGCVSIGVSCLVLLILKNSFKPSSKKDEDKEKVLVKDSNYSRLRLLKLPGYLGVCLSYLVIKLVQNGCLYWTQLFIVQERKLPVLAGSAFVSSLEFGGIVGSFLAGFSSDLLIKQNPRVPKHIVRKIVVLYFIFLLLLTYLWITLGVQVDSSKIKLMAMGFLAGLSIYGPISIYGVIAMESGPDEYAGTLHAIAGMFANAGMLLAGFPLSYIAKLFNWQAVFVVQSIILFVDIVYLFFKCRSDIKMYSFGYLRKFVLA